MDLKNKYIKEIIPNLKNILSKKNIYSLPKITKVIVHIGLKEALENPKVIDLVRVDLETITGQKPTVTKAKKSIATFKVRQGDKIGLKVTLRGIRAYHFLEKLINIVLPRVRDFRGVKLTGFDSRGNYTLGIVEYTVFPEVDAGKIDKIRGLEITINTTAKNKKEAQLLLSQMGMPFEKSGNQ